MTVRPGIIKYGDFICLMAEEGQISFGPAEQTQYLKILITIDQRPPDYVLYQMDIVLDLNEPKEENEFELCRFNLIGNC